MPTTPQTNTAHPIPIVALCGFLGSGKTTLLRRWRQDKALSDTAYVVHDLSELGLDAELLATEDQTPEAGHLEGRVAALHGVHASDKLQSSLKKVLGQISDLSPSAPLVLCESTGAARPWPLIKALTQDARYFLRHFIVTVDALNLHRDFSNGRSLLLEAEDLGLAHPAMEHAAQILAEQIAFSSIIILTKVDTLSEAVINEQVRNLQQLHATATIALSARAGLTLSQLENTPKPDLISLSSKAEKLGLLHQNSTADHVEAVILRDPRPFHPERLHAACQNHLGMGLYRTKGFLWMASRSAETLLWQQSGSQISLELRGLWRSEIVNNPDGKLLPEEIEQLQEMLKNEHPIFGDRHNELTLIGIKRDREAFLSALKAALCTEEAVSYTHLTLPTTSRV